MPYSPRNCGVFGHLSDVRGIPTSIRWTIIAVSTSQIGTDKLFAKNGRFERQKTFGIEGRGTLT